MRLLPLPLAALALAACGEDPVVVGCEAFIREQLRSPSTYERIEVASDEEVLARDSIDGRASAMMPDEQIDEVLGDRESLRLAVATIEYDAANAYGTPIRDEETCFFAREEGQLFTGDQLAREGRSRALLVAYLRDFEPEVLDAHFPHCCLPNLGNDDMRADPAVADAGA